jgi:formate dehydrogenase iron-sulfur subunit
MKAILTDTTKCIGCGQCVIACKQVNKLEDDMPRRWTLNDGLSSRNWTSVVVREGDKFVRKQCRHCIDPACMSVCPVGAFSKTADGAVVYDSTKCIGCRYCMMACPYGIPRYDWDKAVPYVQKCNLCAPRLAEGKQPGCTEACPTKATIFGDRDELLTEAKKRLAAEPHKYIQKVWGEHEVGGTCVLYISGIDLDFLHYGQPIGNKPLPELTAPAMNAVPFAFVGMGSVMAGLHWFFKRKEKVAGVEADENEKERRNG